MIAQPLTNTWEQRLYHLAQTAMIGSTKEANLSATHHVKDDYQEALMACEAIIAQNSRSFYLASSLLPMPKRQAMRALYAFCRTADNLADDDLEQPFAELQLLREGISLQNRESGNIILTAWHEISHRYQIPVSFARQLLDGVERDLVQWRYETFEDLAVYCYSVASTVGLMSMYITGFASPLAIPYAIKLGVALQLTNILRDVREDWEAGRLYLPLEELILFGLDENDIANHSQNENWHAFMRFQIARARQLYTEAMPGIAWLHPDGRFAVASAAHLYQGILDDIEQHHYDVFSRRSYVTRNRKLRLLLDAFWFVQKLRVSSLSKQLFGKKSTEGNYGF